MRAFAVYVGARNGMILAAAGCAFASSKSSPHYLSPSESEGWYRNSIAMDTLNNCGLPWHDSGFICTLELLSRLLAAGGALFSWADASLVRADLGKNTRGALLTGNHLADGCGSREPGRC